MEEELESKANLVKVQIEKDFKNLNEQELEDIFEESKEMLSFLDYYNHTVLDKEKIDFGQFKSRWGIQGMKKEVINAFNENCDKLKEEILTKKDIKTFFEKHCCQQRKEASFCSKLFHTILPNEFPPVDNPIKDNFRLQKEEFIKSVLIIKRGYELFIQENQDTINLIRKMLSKPKFVYLRINESSNIRILDIFYHIRTSF